LLFFRFQSDTFLTQSNFSNILIQTSINIIIATGMTFVISAAEIDLSVGSLLAVCGMITATLLKIDPVTGVNFSMQIANQATAYLPQFPFCLSRRSCGGLLRQDRFYVGATTRDSGGDPWELWWLYLAFPVLSSPWVL
jgi:ribose/xylose/arabinose/galactoside ABC-type transport system permease subunit